jgi:hypothetical protein
LKLCVSSVISSRPRSGTSKSRSPKATRRVAEARRATRRVTRRASTKAATSASTSTVSTRSAYSMVCSSWKILLALADAS